MTERQGVFSIRLPRFGLKLIRASLRIVLMLLLGGCNQQTAELPQAFNEALPAVASDLYQRPNILLILVDDLGFADLGVTGSEIRTPHLDRLSSQGMLLTGLYSMPACSPSRAALMSGVDPHRSGLGSMQEGLQKHQKGKPGYEGYLNYRVVAVPRLLSDAGYHTHMVGKWHLGARAGQVPSDRGFDNSFALVGGGASHFADGAGLVVFEPKVTYLDNGRETDLPDDFFSSRFYTDKLIEYIKKQPEDNRPFFAYAAYTAPHWPLQAPDEDLDLYRGKYDRGYEAVLAARVERQRKSGLFPRDAKVAEFPAKVKSWNELQPSEQRYQARLMEIYAAMVEGVDREVGRLLKWLEETGRAENTLVMFTSDNGPEGNNISQLPLNRFWIPWRFDNSFENMGRENSYLWTDGGWAHVSSGPLRYYKTFPTEGGIRVPGIVRGPGVQQGRNASMATFMDIAATMLDYAGLQVPEGRYRGREALALDGHTLRPMWEADNEGKIARDEAQAIELFGRRMVRIGDYKAVWLPPPQGDSQWQLFNLADDPGETQDLAAMQPEMLAKFEEAWLAYQQKQGVILPGPDAAYTKD